MASAIQAEAVGRTISRYVDENTMAAKAMVLSHTERFEKALAAAMQCRNSQVLAQTTRMTSLIPAAKSLAALGRYEAAADVVENDFGPMIDAQRTRLMSSQLLALVLILHHLQRHERINELAGIAYAYARDSRGIDSEVRRNLANIIGGDEAFAALPRPGPADLTTERVASVVDDLITEIREVIARFAPGPLAEAATEAV